MSEERARIVLVRHAPVRFPAGKWIAASGVRHAVADYNTAPIISADAPREIQDLVQPAPMVFASSLDRSIRTAELLARGRKVIVDTIFDEAALPSPRGVVPLLPIRVWFVALRLLWLMGWTAGAEPRSSTRLRARAAAERLALASGTDGLVVHVGHGICMAFISQELERMGWRRLDPVPRRPWSACRLARRT